MTVKNKTKKFISGLFVVLILLPAVLFSFPKKGYALWGAGDVGTNPVGDASSAITAVETTGIAVSEASQLALKLKDVAIEVGKQLLKAVAKRVLAEMTKSIINWINSGFHGSPLFLENPQSFFNDIAKSELKTIVDMFGYDLLRYPFGKQFALNAINSYKSQLATNAQYTLSTVMNSAQLRLYQNNFNYGGWNGFLINTQYPQNNYLGFNMLATEYLASRVQGTVQNAAGKVQSLLQQGSGFLSPQTCPSNPAYNNGTNEFQRPTFDENAYAQSNPYPEDASSDQANQWTADHDAAKAEWAQENTCPGGLVNTTPGSIAKDQIAGALNAPILQTALDGALGNSLSAIFDALINKFIGDGLNALASKVNPAPISDDWSYNGITLGSPAPTGTKAPWNSDPDQPIILSDFNQMIDEAIGSNITEIKLMYNDVQIKMDAAGRITNTPDNYPGIYQMLGKVWPKAQKLDECIPGPDMDFQDRLDAEIERHKKEIAEKASAFLGGGDVPASEAVMKELTSAASLFKDWIENKMMLELPSSLLYLDAVKSIKTLSQGSSQITDERIAKNRALVRLKAIKKNLETITTQPKPRSAEDKILVSIWKQYQAASADFSNTNTIENTRNKLSEIKDMYNNLIDSLDPQKPTSCPSERIAKGWDNPGGPDGVFKINNISETEKAMFCEGPIQGGYSHGMFKNPNNPTHPEIPLVNGKKVWNYKTVTLKSLGKAIGASFIIGGGLFSPLSLYEESQYSIILSCDNIFNTDFSTYKGNLPGTELPPNNIGGPILGNCRYGNGTVETNITQRQCELNGGAWGPLEPLGTCAVPIPNTNPIQVVPVPNTTKSDCSGVGGTWTTNSGGKPITIPPVNPNNLVITPANILVPVNRTTSSIVISGGIPPYVIVSPPKDPDTGEHSAGILTVEISPSTPNILTVIAYSFGINLVVVKDSSNPVKYASVTITVGN